MILVPRASRHSSLALSTAPNSIRARRSASSHGVPLRIKSSASVSTWKRSSASISLSIRERLSVALHHDRSLLQIVILLPVCYLQFARLSAPSFVPQRHHRIDPPSAASGEVRRCDR